MSELDDTSTTQQRDEAAVHAIRHGNAERYRELVERHERRVFAVAWSRLGDATLAEEVTQESFIRAYQRLWLLGEGAKFGGWISSIARRLAINCGIRHRRELDKRELWALEQGSDHGSCGPATGRAEHLETDRGQNLPSFETLQQTLAELAPGHRECLVLFYLQGQSGAQSAQALGISESAFRVRLHRARAALRERLEAQLETSLVRLRPSKSLVPAIMTGVLAASSAQAAASASIGASLLSGLAKLTPFKWALVILPAVQALPMLIFSWIFHRREARKFRDPSGFRVRIFRRVSWRNTLWIFGVLVVLLTIQRLTGESFRKERFLLGIACFNLAAWGSLYRQTWINRNPYQLTLATTTGLTTMACLLVGSGWLPMSWFNVFLVVQLAAGALVNSQRPRRLDYNLFLRAQEGMLPDTPARSKPVVSPNGDSHTKADLMEFGRFLGSHWLVVGYRWADNGLLLRMPPIDFQTWERFGWLRPWAERSTLLLTYDGHVRSSLSHRDSEALAANGSCAPVPGVPARQDPEARVEAAVEVAWEAFAQRQISAAESALGEVAESELFLKSSARGGLFRWSLRAVWVALILGVVLLGRHYLS